jgi:prepilin-type N-terminal cleavage/methylation domain-containing protein
VTAPLSRRARRVRLGAFSLVEVLIAVAIFSITMLGFLMGLFYMQRQNRSITQREVATAKAVELLELFKNMSYDEVTYSTVATPRYLKKTAAGAANTAWKVPVVSTWMTLPVEDVNPASSADPTIVTNKLPSGRWTVTINELTQGTTPSWKFKRVTVTVEWKILTGETQAQTVTMSTDLSYNFTWL